MSCRSGDLNGVRRTSRAEYLWVGPTVLLPDEPGIDATIGSYVEMLVYEPFSTIAPFS